MIYLHREKNIAVNEEVIDDAVKELGIAREELEQVKTAEVGNIFNFGSQKTDEMGLYYTGEDGQQHSLHIGSYGIGITRAMGVIAEKMSDDRGLVWPEAIAPFKVYLVAIGEQGTEAAEKVYSELTAAGVEVLYDDRNERPGAKFADAELMGIPYRLTVSDRTVASGAYEVVSRKTGDVTSCAAEDVVAQFS